MAQVFSPRDELVVKLVLVALAAAATGVVTWGWARNRAYEALGEPVAQPIPFSHKHHVGDDGIDCRYCHTTVETSRHAGLPSTQICLSCHSQLYNDAAVLAPLRESARTGVPIAWQRVHDLPGFVYFDHSVHLAKGVACLECHGHVDQMPLTWRAQPLQMQWCLGCHENPAAHLRSPAQVFDMQPAPLRKQERAQLVRLLQLESKSRRTDCSTCHR
jgi:hypothetical protein